MNKKARSIASILLGISLLAACTPTTTPVTTSAAGGTTTAGSTTAGSTTASTTGAGTTTGTKETTFGIKPFEKRQELRIGYFAGSALSIPFYIADKEGLFDELNIDVKYETFTNGPAMMEANADWDMGGAGSAGVLVGQIGFDLPMIGISDFEANQALFVRADSPLAKDSDNPENWKGTKWLYPVGTTAHFTLSTKLNKVGLTDADITSVNMDVSSALNAFKGGEGDGLAVWNAFALRAEADGFKRISDAGQLDITNSSGTLVTRDALKNKRDLIVKSWAVYYKTVDWIKASDANFDKAVKYYLESANEEGIQLDEPIARGIMKYFAAPGFDEMVKLMTETAPDPKGLFKERELLKAEIDLLVTMDFFVSQGKYTPENREKLLKNRLVDPSIAVEAAELFK